MSSPSCGPCNFEYAFQLSLDVRSLGSSVACNVQLGLFACRTSDLPVDSLNAHFQYSPFSTHQHLCFMENKFTRTILFSLCKTVAPASREENRSISQKFHFLFDQNFYWSGVGRRCIWVTLLKDSHQLPFPCMYSLNKHKWNIE